jgi:outer membrane protein assembly factor BamB
MNPTKCLVSVLSVLLLASLSYADNWPRFRGPNGEGVAADKDIPVKFNLKSGDGVVWKIKLPGVGASSPVVWDKNLFIQCSSKDGSKRFLSCVNVADGKIVWTREFPGTTSKRINKLNSLASATPATDGEAVYAAFWDGKEISLAAYSIKGDLMWSKNLGRWDSQHGPGHSPIIYKDKVIFCNDMDAKDAQENDVPNPSVLRVFNKKTGDIVWEAPREAFRACYSAPSILEKPGSKSELVVTSTTSIRSYNPDNGQVNWDFRWKFTAKFPLRTAASTIFHDNRMFASSGDGGGDRHMIAVQLMGPKAPEQIWENKKDFPYVPCMLARGEHLYFVNDKGFAGCFHAATGKRVWFERVSDTPATFYSSPVLIDGKMYAVSEAGDMFVIPAETKYQVLAKSSIGEVVRATPAVSNNRLYVRGMENLYCIGKR